MKPKTIKYKDYNENYRQTHRDELNKKSTKYYNTHKDEVSKKNKDKYSKMTEENKKLLHSKNSKSVMKSYNFYKSKFLEMYGSCCECCGESTIEFLSIEHKLGQAGKKKDTSHGAYKKAVLEYQPNIYGILCHNCNQASKNGRICPHKR